MNLHGIRKHAREKRHEIKRLEEKKKRARGSEERKWIELEITHREKELQVLKKKEYKKKRENK